MSGFLNLIATFLKKSQIYIRKPRIHKFHFVKLSKQTGKVNSPCVSLKTRQYKSAQQDGLYIYY